MHWIRNVFSGGINRRLEDFPWPLAPMIKTTVPMTFSVAVLLMCVAF